MNGKRGILAGVVFAGLAMGCLELDETITIRPDGSGTQQVTMHLPREMLRKTAAHASALAQQRFDVTAIFDKKQATAEFAAAGLSLGKHTVRERRSSQTLELEAGFRDLGMLRNSPLTGGKADWILKKGGEGRTALFYYPTGKAGWKDARKRIKALGKNPPTPRMLAFFRKKQAEMKGLDIRLTLNLPGRVLRKSKNLQAGKTPNQVIARITAAQIRSPADLLSMMAPCYIIEFDSRQCSFGPNPGRNGPARPGPATKPLTSKPNR